MRCTHTLRGRKWLEGKKKKPEKSKRAKKNFFYSRQLIFKIRYIHSVVLKQEAYLSTSEGIQQG